MSMNDKRRLPAGEPGRRHETNCYRNGSTSLSDCQARLIDALGVGAEHATKTTDLLRMTDIQTPRELRHIVATLRKSGALILANGDGYFLPGPGEAGRDEVAAFVRYVDGKAAATFRAADAARKYLRDVIPGQQTFTTAAGGEDDAEA